MLIKVIALLFVIAVIFAECLVAFLFIGGSGGTDQAASAAEHDAADGSEPAGESSDTGHAAKKGGAHAQTAHPAKAEHGKAGHTKEAPPKGDAGKHSQGDKKAGHSSKSGGSQAEPGSKSLTDMVEIDLERFVVTAYQPNSSTIVRVDFHLFGIVAAKDEEEFRTLMEVHQHRFREQVLVIVRRAEPADLADPGLGLIKRQILEKTNALLGKPLLQALVVSDFSYLEQ